MRVLDENRMEERAVAVMEQALLETQRAFDGVASEYDRSNAVNPTLCEGQIHGAVHMQDILNERVKPWLETRVIVIDDWIARGLLAPVDAQTLMFMIWATTQHYADFDAQIRALKGKRALSQKAFDASTEEVIKLVIRACGAKSPR